MASIDLTTVWINDWSSVADVQSFPLMSRLSVETSTPGKVQTYANGRLRYIGSPTRSRSWSIDLQACTRDQVSWLEDHAGRIVCARDDRGRKVFGVFVSVPADEHQYDDETDVSLSLAEVTVSEAV